MASKLSRFSSRNVPIARPRACAKCGSVFHTICNRDSKPLARNTPVRKFREEPRRVDRATDRYDTPTPAEKAYMARVRLRECCALGMPGHPFCVGEPVVHHAGRHGMGFKSSHFETIRLCDKAHRELHEKPGNGWTAASKLDGEGVRAFEDKHIALTQRALGYSPLPAA